jgi:hypothetical protein
MIYNLFIIETQKIIVTATNIIIMIKMLYNRRTGIYKIRNNTYPRRIRRSSNLGNIFLGKGCVTWAEKYSMYNCHKPLELNNI